MDLLQTLTDRAPEGLEKKYIVKMLDQFRHKGPNGNHLCVVTELLGPNLAYLYNEQRLRVTKRPKHILALTVQLLTALSFIHEAGIAHGGTSSPLSVDLTHDIQTYSLTTWCLQATAWRILPRMKLLTCLETETRLTWRGWMANPLKKARRVKNTCQLNGLLLGRSSMIISRSVSSISLRHSGTINLWQNQPVPKDLAHQNYTLRIATIFA
jgi:hypothetical protein